MADAKFKLGNVVKHKTHDSHMPLMTINFMGETYKDGQAGKDKSYCVCKYYSRTGEFIETTFHEDELELVRQ